MIGKIDIFFKIFFIISLLTLALGVWDIRSRFESISAGREKPVSIEVDEVKNLENFEDKECGQKCRQEIARVVAEAVATISGETVVEKEVVTVAYAKQTSYIPLGSTFSTTSTSWVDVPDSGVFIDAENDYSKDAKISWEASLKVAHGNGKAFARLYDDTNKIAVDFSEMSSENNSSFTQVVSSNLPFWRGRNLYKVQIKSLNSFEVTLSGARIKVVNK